VKPTREVAQRYDRSALRRAAAPGAGVRPRPPMEQGPLILVETRKN